MKREQGIFIAGMLAMFALGILLAPDSLSPCLGSWILFLFLVIWILWQALPKSRN